jgi:hypothetical protein
MNDRNRKRFACAAVTVLAGLLAGNAIAQRIDGHPDLSGLWTTYRSPAGDGAAPGGPVGQAGDVAMTPMAQAKVDAYRAVTEGTNHSPGAYCVGSGMPGSMVGAGGYPMEILQHPRQINVTYELHGEMRRIYIGDHGFEFDDIFHERNGFSVGHWEDDTLVVEVSHLVEQVDSRIPHSDQARIVERYTLSEEDGRSVLANEWTMTDPLFLEEPMSGVKRWQRVEGGRLMNYECTEPEWLDIVQRLLAGEEIGYQGE